MAKELITKYADMHLQSVMMNSGIGDDLEAIYVTGIILKYIRECRANLRKKIDEPRVMIVPQLHKRLDGSEQDIVFAEKSLIAIGLFREHLEWLTKFRGHPEYHNYGDTSRQIYFDFGREGFSKRFYDWTDFLHDHLEIREEPEGIVKSVCANPKYHKAFPDLGKWKLPGFLSEN